MTKIAEALLTGALRIGADNPFLVWMGTLPKGSIVMIEGAGHDLGFGEEKVNWISLVSRVANATNFDIDTYHNMEKKRGCAIYAFTPKEGKKITDLYAFISREHLKPMLSTFTYGHQVFQIGMHAPPYND